MRCIFVRHGRTMFNELGLTQGWCDSPLTDAGIQQAIETGNLLRDMKIDVAYSSSSNRAYETAEYILGDRGLLITRDKRLREFFFGWYEGTPEKLKFKFIEHDFKTKDFKLDFSFAGGETSQQMLDREMEFINDVLLENDDRTVLIVGHGVGLSVLVRHIAAESFEERYPDFRMLGNACAVIIEYKNGVFTVEQIVGEYFS